MLIVDLIVACFSMALLSMLWLVLLLFSLSLLMMLLLLLQVLLFLLLVLYNFQTVLEMSRDDSTTNAFDKIQLIGPPDEVYTMLQLLVFYDFKA